MSASDISAITQLIYILESMGIVWVLRETANWISGNTSSGKETKTLKKSKVKKGSLNKSKEVQKHGKVIEKDILKTYNVPVEILCKISYTSTHDLPSEYNERNGKNVSIKTTGKNSICCGDAERFYDSTNDHNMEMVIVQYTQEGQYKIFKMIIVIDLNKCKSHLFKDSLRREEITELANAIKKIPQKRKPTLEEKNYYEQIKRNLSPKLGHLTLNPKCNSQQSRLQCSIRNIQTLLKDCPECLLYQNYKPYYNGKKLIERIYSPPRTFKGKVK